MFAAMQTSEQITGHAAVTQHTRLNICEIKSADLLIVGFGNLFVNSHLNQIVPSDISKKRAEVITVRIPVFLLPAVIARRAVYQLIKLCRIRDFVNTVRVLEFSVELLGSLTACDALGTKTINFLYGIKR